ncbi:hypothetical protein OG552_19255 [Streptomyces sp. NBC_01476]|uniref:hypothetical protein n=1 Tax=Streptomyces sp. NBC_01476 TaxID=2903881 RepID=UPI002E34D6C8|nr:hypothetical protein [Streptomyces sp. NBC_01476]
MSAVLSHADGSARISRSAFISSTLRAYGTLSATSRARWMIKALRCSSGISTTVDMAWSAADAGLPEMAAHIAWANEKGPGH